MKIVRCPVCRSRAEVYDEPRGMIGGHLTPQYRPCGVAVMSLADAQAIKEMTEREGERLARSAHP